MILLKYGSKMPFKKLGNLILGLRIMAILKLNEGLEFCQADIEVVGILICMKSKRQKLDEELQEILIAMRRF